MLINRKNIFISTKRSAFRAILVLLLSLFGLPANASLFEIDLTDPATFAFMGTVVGPGVEVGLNTKYFNPAGIELDMAASYVAISSGMHGDVSINNNGLLVIGYSGFILRFDESVTVTSVQMKFNDFYDDGTRNLYAYDTLIDYTRDAADINWTPKGSVIENPQILGAIDSDTGIIPNGNSGNTILLSVSGSNIRSVWANTPPLFNGLSSISIEMNTSTVPLPSSLALFSLGLAGLRFSRKRLSRSA